MIVRCPECQTGFNLAKEKIPAKGAKLRCSKCNHLFRVRVTDDRTEIFYKSSDKEKNRNHVDPNATQIGGPHRPKMEQVRETHQLETVERGGETRFGAPARTGTSPRTKGVRVSKTQQSFSDDQRTFAPVKPTMKALRAPILTPIVTPPRTKEKSLVEEKPDAIAPTKPTIASPRRKLTPVPSDHLDLFGDDSGFNFSNNDPSIEDPFFGAFDDPEEEELFPTTNKQPFFRGEAFSNETSTQKNESIAISEISIVETKVKPPSLPPTPENPSPPRGFQSNSLDDSKNEEDYFSRGGIARSFESLAPSSEVSEAENKDTPLDIDLGTAEKKEDVKAKKREPKLELAIKPQAINKPRKKPSASAKSGTRSPRKESAQARQPIALKPHKIGGNSFRRLFDTLFIALFLSACFIAFIAYKAGGIFDFNHPLHMLEVAFEGKPYESDTFHNLYISDVTAIPYELAEKNHILIVNGSIHNPNNKSKNAKPLYVIISTKDGEEKQEVHMGEHLDLSQFKERVKGKSLTTVQVDTFKKGSTPFFVVFRKGDAFQKLSLRTQFEQ